MDSSSHILSSVNPFSKSNFTFSNLLLFKLSFEILKLFEKFISDITSSLKLLIG